MKNRKRLLTLALLCVALAFSVLGLFACGNGNNSSENDNSNPFGLAFALTDEDTYSVSVGLATERSVIVIPATYNNKPVTKIANKAFNECKILKTISIPDSVTSIGEYAFNDCEALNSITIGKGVTNIGDNAFNNCPIEYISAPAFVFDYVNIETLKTVVITSGDSVGEKIFYNCTSLISVTIPDSVTSIGKDAFSGCYSLTSIIIPNSVISIGDEAFSGCYKLVEVINKSNLNITKDSSDNGYLGYYALNVKTDGQSDIVNKNDCLFYTYNNINYLLGYVGNDTNLNLPKNYNGENYQIYYCAFFGCYSLTSVTITDSVTSIGKYAFEKCTSLTSVTIPDSVTSIGNGAFSGCSSLTSVTIPDSVTSIGKYAFYNCTSLTSVTIPDSVTSIGSSAFYSCYSLKNIYYTGDINSWVEKIDGLYYLMGYGESDKKLYIQGELLTEANITTATKINGYAFRKCSSLTSVAIPDSVTSIGDRAFDDCPIKYVSAPAFAFGYIGKYYLKTVIITSGNNIGDSAFYYCTSLTSITIPDGVTSIGNFAFYDCTSLTCITIPDSVTSIGEWAFSGCSSLTSITIPDSVTSIGEYAFDNCNSLKAVYITDISAWCNIKFNSYTSNPLSYAHNLYLNGELVTNIVIPDSVTSIGDYAFCDCTSLKSVTISNSVTTIGNRAFWDCTSLTSITIPDSVTSIGRSAFSNCRSLTSIIIPNSVISIGDEAFSGCYKLVEVINKSNLNITKHSSDNGDVGYYALNVKTDGQSDIVNKNDYLFYTYNNINYLLGYVGNETNLNLPENYNGENYQIYKFAFYNCTSLTSVIIPDSVTRIGNYAFYGGKELKTINYTGSEAQWESISKGDAWDWGTAYNINYNYVIPTNENA